MVLVMHFFDNDKTSEVKNFLDSASNGRGGRLACHELKSFTMPGQLKISPESARIIIQSQLSTLEIGRRIDREITNSTNDAKEISFRIISKDAKNFLVTLSVKQIPFEKIPKDTLKKHRMRAGDVYREVLMEAIEILTKK
mgnify:FL=1